MANVILEIGIMIDQAVVDHKLLPHLTGEIEKNLVLRLHLGMLLPNIPIRQ